MHAVVDSFAVRIQLLLAYLSDDRLMAYTADVVEQQYFASTFYSVWELAYDDSHLLSMLLATMFSHTSRFEN